LIQEKTDGLPIDLQTSVQLAQLVYGETFKLSSPEKTIFKPTEIISDDSAYVSLTNSMVQGISAVSETLRMLKAEMNPAPPQELESDYEIEDFISKFETRYYKLPSQGTEVGFKVVLSALEGDPDLYVCQRNSKPDKNNHTYRSASEGIDVVQVLPGHPHFFAGNVYVGVYGHDRSHFKLKASWIEKKQSTSLDTAQYKKKASIRVAEKIEISRVNRMRVNMKTKSIPQRRRLIQQGDFRVSGKTDTSTSVAYVSSPYMIQHRPRDYTKQCGMPLAPRKVPEGSAFLKHETLLLEKQLLACKERINKRINIPRRIHKPTCAKDTFLGIPWTRNAMHYGDLECLSDFEIHKNRQMSKRL